MQEDEIIKQTLYKLDGWVLKEDITSDDEFEELIETEYNKIITSDEILHYYSVATDYALSYTQRTVLDTITVADTSIILWTAGLIWNKYNIRTSDQLDDENNFSMGYGDKLIIQAKEILKPYINYDFKIY